MAQTPDQARLLLDESHLSVLKEVLRVERGAGEVALRTALPLKQVHHRLGRLVESGLVTVVGEKSRQGRPVKLYRAVAPAYRVPLPLLAAADLRELLLHLMKVPMQERAQAAASFYQRNFNMEIQVVPDKTGELALNLNPADLLDQPLRPTYGAFMTFSTARLTAPTFDGAEKRLREFNDWLTERIKEEQHDPHATPALLSLGIVPASKV